ncbi:MAG: DUF2336 domain-containing protein [Alphaproteobacteria bacterium]|nr:DUF2336 domain-containing protein [Alphaproteobacteria bacterium]
MIANGLLTILNDENPLPRLCFSKAIAREGNAPHHFVVALMRDNLDIAAPVILYSPVLRDYDLEELISESDEQTYEIIASRLHLSFDVSSLLASQGGVLSCINLLSNPTAFISQDTLALIAERHINDPRVCVAILERTDIPISIRQMLMTTLCEALIHDQYVASVPPQRVRRIIRETWERMTVEMIRTADENERRMLISHLRSNDKLNASLLLRALIYGDFFFFEESLADLAKLPMDRASRLAKDYSGLGFRALYDCAGLPPTAYIGFTITVRNVLCMLEAGYDLTVPSLRRHLLEQILDDYEIRSTSSEDAVLKFFLRLYDESMYEGSEPIYEGSEKNLQGVLENVAA